MTTEKKKGRKEKILVENLQIIDAGSEGKAVAKQDGLTIFVPFAVPGDVADVAIFKKKRGYAEAELLAVRQPSPHRIEPRCKHFGLCGGCKWQVMNYDQQLVYKQKQVQDNFAHLGKFDFPPVLPIIPSEAQYFYRNKLEFTFSDLRWLDEEDMKRQQAGAPLETRGLGFHIPSKFDKVLDIDFCYLQAEPSNAIRLAIKQFAIENDIPFYNVRRHEGTLRNVIIRSSSTGELMVIVIFTEKNEKTMRLLEFLSEKFPQITSLQYVLNKKLNDMITDLPIETFRGLPFIYEKMEDLRFKIGPVSFYQTNSAQAYNLYKTARDFAQISPDDLVYDLYTGTGTIANFVAKSAKKVVGIEYVDAAIEDAKANSALNGISNTAFFAGDMAKVLTADFVAEQGAPDVVITDPPRAGMHQKVIDQLLAIEPKRIVYVSCNPATQARDLTLLDEKYKVEKVQPVDMFPQTQHVENVALLVRRTLATLLVLLGCLLPFIGAAQGNLKLLVTSNSGVVAGSLIDNYAKAMEYAMLTVVSAADTSALASGLTDGEGKFAISGVPFGTTAMLKIETMGYRNHFTEPFTLTAENPIKRFPKYKLTQRSTSLQTVEVVAQKEMLQTNLDKQVFNVESSVVTDGATASEVLEEIPSVDVDLDGNVTLRGSENVTVLVDGRPSNLTLDQIPASEIESIEVITNPSARLEPDGMAGILNVVLKKRKGSGFNGMVRLGSGLSLFKDKPFVNRANGNVSLNYNYNKVNVFLNYDFRWNQFRNEGSLDRTSWFERDTNRLAQANDGVGGGMGHNIRAGLDWFINKKNTLSFTFGYNNHGHNNKNNLRSENWRYEPVFGGISDSGDTLFDRHELLFLGYDQRSTRDNGSDNFSASINYKKTFETKGMELTSDIYFTQRSGKAQSAEPQFFFAPDTSIYWQETTTKDINRNATAQVDFITPVGNGGRIETGYKLTYRNVGQDYSLFSGPGENELMEDTAQRNNFLYTEAINALYFIYSNSFWEKLKVQVGVRGELAYSLADLKSKNHKYEKLYPNLFPTAHIRYDFNPNHSLQVSYSMRVQRPRIWQLNPFIDYSDKQNWRTGNPNLKPEIVNSVELGYLMTIQKTSLNVTAFYRQRNDIITRFTDLVNDTTTLTSYANLNKSQNLGFELTFGQRLWKFWKIMATGSFYYESIESNNLIDKSLSNNFTWNFRINQSFTLPKSWELQLNFRYRSPSLTTGSMGWGTGGIGQGRRAARFSLNAGVKKSFFNNNFVISLNARNILYTRQTKIHTYSSVSKNGYDAYSTRIRNGLQVNLTLTYKFNNYKQRREKNAENGESMEMMGED